MQTDRRRYETAFFWILVSVLAMAALVLIAEGFPWPGRGYLIDTPLLSGFDMLTLHAALTLASVHVLTVILGSIGLAAIARRDPGMITIMAFVPFVAISNAIDLVRFGVLFLGAGVLTISWFVPRLTRFRATPGHVVTGAALLSISLLQGLTHAGLLMPSYEVRNARLAEAGEVIDRTSGPKEIERLVELGLIALTPVTADSLSDHLRQANAPDPAAATVTLAQIAADAPPILHRWTLEGWNARWRVMMIYDGRGDAPRSWMVRPDWSNRPVMDAVAQIALVTGLTGPIWGILALIVLRRQSRTSARTEEEAQ